MDTSREKRKGRGGWLSFDHFNSKKKELEVSISNQMSKNE
jgi:hypothetical protein